MTLAVVLYDWLKTIHVLAAVIWVGGGAALTIVAFMTVRENDPLQLAAFADKASKIGQRLFMPASFVLVALGFWMVSEGHWGYGHFWVIYAIAGWALSAATGALYLGPTSARLSKQIADRGPADPEVQAAIKQILLVVRVDVALMLSIVFFMTLKP